jgi:hypothetical protein
MFSQTVRVALTVAPLVVGVEELTWSSLDDVEIVCLAQELELSVGDVLGISLSEVQALYFQHSDKGRDSEVGQDLVEEWNYGDVILNHIQSGRYWSENIDGVLYSSYHKDA